MFDLGLVRKVHNEDGDDAGEETGSQTSKLE